MTRIPLDEFAHEISDILRRVSATGEPIEVVWADGGVVISPSERPRPDGPLERPMLEQEVVVTDSSQLITPSPELVAQRRAALARLDKLREEIARDHPGVVFDAVVDINADREERSRELDLR